MSFTSFDHPSKYVSKEQAQVNQWQGSTSQYAKQYAPKAAPVEATQKIEPLKKRMDRQRITGAFQGGFNNKRPVQAVTHFSEGEDKVRGGVNKWVDLSREPPVIEHKKKGFNALF